MSLSFPIIRLPSLLVDLCTQELRSSKKSYAIISDYVFNDKFLGLVFKRVLNKSELDSTEMEKFLNVSGWINFRDYIASFYLQREILGHYDFEIDNTCLMDLKALEERFKDHHYTGLSRLFLMGAYLFIANEKIENNEIVADSMVIPSGVDRLLELKAVRHEKIDWLIILLWHLVDVWGEDKAIALVEKSNGNFYRILKDLPEENQQILINNMLNYGCSLGEDEFFLAQKV